MHFGVSYYPHFRNGDWYPDRLLGWYPGFFTGWADRLSREAATPPASCGKLAPGGVLATNAPLTSCDGRFSLVMQGDGNMVLYHNGRGAIWNTATTGTAARHTVMQTDGNFVLYPPSGPAIWHTHTNSPGAFLAVQNDGNLVVYSSGGQALWNSGTCCR